MPTLILFLSVLLTACTIGPDYVKPTVTIPEKFKEYKDWKIAQPNDAYDRGNWWTIFRDPQLNALEAQLNISNQTIAKTEAQYRQAQALVDEARSAYFPTISIAPTVLRQLQPNGTNNTNAGGLSTSTSLLLDASWTPDLWGEVRRKVETNSADAEASAAELALARLTAQAKLAQAYFELRALDTNQKLLDNTVVDYQKSLQLTKNRYAAGVVQQLDVLQAKSQLETAQAQALNNGIKRAEYEHAIAVLIGQPPAFFKLNFKPLTATPPAIPLVVPSQLLERRPDIAKEERLMAKANAKIGMEMAAYYPKLSLSGMSYGFQNTSMSLAKLLSTSSLTWSIGPKLSETLFDGGERAAKLKGAYAGYDAAVASYRQTVLEAFQKVEDNLAALRILAQEAAVRNQAAADARRALMITMNQYKAGVVAYAAVIEEQTKTYIAQKAVADVNGLRMSTAVKLIMELGGGWD